MSKEKLLWFNLRENSQPKKRAAHMERPASQTKLLFLLFGLVVVLGQFDEKKPKTRRLLLSLVNGYDAELVGIARAEFVTAG
jgi:hypothetical protein